MSEIDFIRLTPAGQMVGENAAETEELKQMLAHAEEYIKSFHWCPKITERYFGAGVGGVFALFLFKFDRSINADDDRLWVVEGDLPSAYFVTDHAHDPASALATYCQLMDDWAGAILNGRPLDTVFPIAVSPTVEHANMLKSRTTFIRDSIIPMLR